MKITDVTVKRYSASRERPDAAGIQIVEVHTEAGVTGTGLVSMASGGSATSDITATLIRRKEMVLALEGDEPGAGNACRQRAAALDRADGIAAHVHHERGRGHSGKKDAPRELRRGKI